MLNPSLSVQSEEPPLEPFITTQKPSALDFSQAPTLPNKKRLPGRAALDAVLARRWLETNEVHALLTNVQELIGMYPLSVSQHQTIPKSK